MEPLPQESKPGYYDAYLSPAGEKYVVIQGLDLEQIHHPAGMEAFMLEHYNILAVLYWLAIVCVFAYLISMYLIIPTIQRWRQSGRLFEE